MDLSIIIVNWNSVHYLKQCIASILAWTTDLTYEIVVVDSASFDGCGEMLRQHFPQVRFIQSDKNLGFARSNNRGYAASRGRSLLFLNPDTELVAPTVNILHDRLRALPDAGAVGCRLLNADRSVQTSCLQAFPTILNQLLDSELMRSWLPKSRLWGNAALFSDEDGPKEVEAISGACMMMKRSTFETAGLFTEDYFMYAEDMDLCYKIRRAGYRNYYVPDATAIHFGGGSTRKAQSDLSVVMMRDSLWRFLRRSRGKMYGAGYRIATLAAALVRLALLGSMLPLHRRRERREALDASWKKWKAILSWSMGSGQTEHLLVDRAKAARQVS